MGVCLIVIASESEATRIFLAARLDCFVAIAPRNDENSGYSLNHHAF